MSVPQVEPPNLKPAGECGCGCGATGTYLVRPDRLGVLHCRTCDKSVCLSCRNRRNKREGARRQRTAARALGIPVSTFPTGQEEDAGGLVRFEAKSGAEVRPAWTAFLNAEAQSEAARPHGDNRPVVICLEPPGVSDGLVCIRRARLVETVAALAEQLGIVS